MRARRDGWTPDTQGRFVAELWRTRNVAAACRRVGRSWQTAYRLRGRPDAAGFAAAWDAALAGPDLSGPFAGRALGGVAEPITYRGRRVGERRRFDDRLAKYILRIRARERFGPATNAAGADAPDRALARLRADPVPARRPRPGGDPAGSVARMSSPSAAAQLAAATPVRERGGRTAPGRPGGMHPIWT